MKVWLNNLKEGDIFYIIALDHVYKCQHCGDAHNRNFLMSTVKFKVFDENDESKYYVNETFVNQYVYDDYESANEDLINIIKKDIGKYEEEIKVNKNCIKSLENRIKTLKEKIEK